MTAPDDDQTPPDAASPAPHDETPVQRALRLKQAAIDARPKPPRAGRFPRETAPPLQAGKSKPWMSR